MSTPRIVVTGIGASTPIGGTAPESWSALLDGASGTHSLQQEWVEEYQLPVTFAAEALVRPDSVLERPVANRLDPSAQFALVAAFEAWEDAGRPEVEPERFAVDFATGIGGLQTTLAGWDTLKTKGPRRVMPMSVPMLMPNAPAAAVSMHLNARGYARTVASACASSTESLVNAFESLRAGRVDVVIAGGAEAVIHPLTIAAFAAMQALSKRNDSPETASRPYSVDRDGFVMGEGAAALVLETEEHAKARGAKIYGEVVGGGVTADSYHITAPEPEGLGASRAVRLALEQAGATPDEVTHINAHATSTPVGDPIEARGIRDLLGGHTDDVLVSATKSMTGHLLGGAGALESVFTIKALEDRKAPPTINVDNPDPDLAINLVRNTPGALPASGDLAAINNSFGFGGHNVALVFGSA